MTSPAIGDIIAGRYEVLDRLGTPGMDAQGESYKVRDHNTHQTVALKVLTSTPLGPWHEARVLASLRDDHILEILNADVAAGRPYIATVLAQHGTLATRLDTTGRIGVDPGVAIRWTRQACQAAARTHALRLIHTDIKPDNLFLDEHDNVRLGDFGLASLMDNNDLGHTAGTAWTLAPEVAQAIIAGQARATSVASDVYSLGATLYELLTGQPAYIPPTGVGLDLVNNAPHIAQHRPARVRDLAPHIPRTLADRVHKAMSPVPADRYDSAGEFAADLGGALAKVHRHWSRTDEHPGHHRCYLGTAKSTAGIMVCVEPDGPRFNVGASKLPHGRRIHDAAVNVTTSAAGLPTTVRKVLAHLS